MTNMPSLGNPSSWPHGKSLSRKEIQAVTSLWLDAGLDPGVVEPLAALAERSRQIAVERTQLTADTSAIAEGLAEGTMSLEEAVTLHALESAASEIPAGKTTSRASILEKAARTHIERKCYRMLTFHGVSLSTQHIEPLFSRLREEAREIAEQLEGIESADAAARSGQEASGLWSRLVALDGKRELLSKITKTLASYGIVETNIEDIGRSFMRLIPEPLDAA